MILSFCPFRGTEAFFVEKYNPFQHFHTQAARQSELKGEIIAMYPECEEIMRLAPDYHIIPVCKEIYADVITPITLLRKIAAVSKRYHLLESVEGGEKWRHFQTVQLWDRQL